MDQEDDDRERILFALDLLSASAALSRSSWLTTTAALRSLESLFSKICFNTTEELATHSDVRFPDHENELFTWFFRTQDNFQTNLASQLLTFLRRLVGRMDRNLDEDEHPQINKWLSHALYLLQGSLLLHASSRSLFSRRANMTFLVDLLSCGHTENVHLDAIQTIVSALVDRPHNLRIFEDVGGLKKVSELFLHPDTGHKVKVRVLEFLYFYLIPESSEATPISGRQATAADDDEDAGTNGYVDSVASTLMIRQHSRQPAEHDEFKIDRHGRRRKTTEEKQKMLGRYFSNIDALVQDLNEFKPFGEF